MEDSGIFAVVAENRGGGAKCSANLVVEEKRTGRSGLVPPSFLSTIQSLNVPSGQLARFDAKLTGTQPLDVYWLKVCKYFHPASNRKIKQLGNRRVVHAAQVA
jgi:titin